MFLSPAFAEAHLAPLPLHYTAKHGSMVTFETLDGKKGSAFFVPSSNSNSKVLIIFHEYWGLNDYIKREAERLQDSLGVDVYAVDLYDGVVATTPEQAGKLSSSLDPDRADNIIKGLLSLIGKDNQVATLGWCMGGTWSFRASVLAGNQAAGCVMYYGFPESRASRIKPLQTDVLYNRAEQDGFIKRADVDAFGRQVEATGHKFIFHSFDAVHAFANPSNPKYNAALAYEANSYAMAFLRSHLQLEQ